MSDETPDDDLDEEELDDDVDPDDLDDDDIDDDADLLVVDDLGDDEDEVIPDVDEALLADDDDDDDDEELELLEEEGAAELAVDEVEELRNIRREELSLNVGGAQEKRSDEFQCSVCFMVKRTSQLANKRKLVCNDCAS